MWLSDRRVRYLFVGAAASIVYYAVFTAGWLISAGRVPYLLMAIIANLVTALATYRLYRDGVFRVGADRTSAGNPVRAFLRFYAICLWSLVVTLAGLPLLIEVCRVPVLIAQAVILALSPVVNYQLHRLWTFAVPRLPASRLSAPRLSAPRLSALRRSAPRLSGARLSSGTPLPDPRLDR